jgi:hypothetical protein
MFSFLSVAGMWIVWHTVGFPAYIKYVKKMEENKK